MFNFKDSISFQDVFNFYLLLRSEILDPMAGNSKQDEKKLGLFLCTTLSDQIIGEGQQGLSFSSWLGKNERLSKFLESSFIQLSSLCSQQQLFQLGIALAETKDSPVDRVSFCRRAKFWPGYLKALR